MLIYNPTARGAPKIEHLRHATAQVAGWDIAIKATQAAAHATELAAAAAAESLDAVVACGGDGTVNEVVNGLAGSATALAVVRGGTANVWAKEIGVSKNVEKALRLLSDGETRLIDLGRAGERYFLLMAGAGFDAAIVREMLLGKMKHRIGAAAYMAAGLRRALRHRAVDAELVIDGGTVFCKLYWMMAGNTRSYGGIVNLAHMAQADDGKLELLVLANGGLRRFAWLMLWVLLKRHHKRRDVIHRSITSVEIRTAGLPVQIDGEYLGETPLRFEVAPRALRVIVPKGLKGALFSVNGYGKDYG